MSNNWMINKKSVLLKMAKYRSALLNNKYALQMIELNYRNNCNFDCDYCFSKYYSNPLKDKINIVDIKKLSEEANRMGVWQWNLQGGEPLKWDELFDVIEAIDPSKYFFMITTNGSLLTEEIAFKLAHAGVDMVAVSLDSINEFEHNEKRKHPESYKKAINALKYIKKAGLQTVINTIVSKQNIKSQQLLNLIEFAKQNSYKIFLSCAAPIGGWAGKIDLLLDEEDSKYLLEMKQKHPFVNRDIYPIFSDINWGCRTMNGLVYITENGDLFSCPFIPIIIGNIREESLDKILKRGWSIKYFRNYNNKCLVSEDKSFVRKILSKTFNKNHPICFDDAFNNDDLYTK